MLGDFPFGVFMTTSFLNTRPPEYRQPVDTPGQCEIPGATRELETGPVRHACEVQRMKDFAGRHRFQAPVADDFARGMLAPGHDPVDGNRPIRGSLASVILGLRSLCTGQRD